MKINPLTQPVVAILALAALATLNSRLSTAFAQGIITPPGPPEPLMKTLDQIEPRTPISQADVPKIITTPGSYVLTGNLQATAAGMDVITVQSDDVTLDLNGFTIHGAGIGASAIEIAGERQSIVIRNGTVRDFTAPAILGIKGRNMQCTRIKAFNAVAGIVVGEGSQVMDCQAVNHSFSGIDLRGPNCQVRNCIVTDANTGILTSDGARVEGCTVIGGSAGIQVRSKCEIRRNTFRANGTACVIQSNGSLIAENQLLDATGFGLFITGTENRLEGNAVKGNADNYDIVPGNHLNLLLCEIPETIDWPASVKLAGTLMGVSGTNGITVNASDVTVDLDGHALVGVSGSEHGIAVTPTYSNVEIRNGTIKDWSGVGILASNALDCAVRKIRARGNGIGMVLGSGGRVIDSFANHNSRGIVAQDGVVVAQCTVISNMTHGIEVFESGSVIGCTAKGNGANGITVSSRAKVTDCSANANGGDGFVLNDACTLIQSTARDNGGDGIEVSEFCNVKDCVSDSNGDEDDAGIRVTGWGNRIEGNTVNRNATGVKLLSLGNLIIRNSARGNNFFIQNTVGNTVGEIYETTIAGEMVNETVGPWANFSFKN